MESQPVFQAKNQANILLLNWFPGARRPHGQVDDEVEVLAAQVVGHAHHLARHRVDLDLLPDVGEIPLD